jgi:hypothetical protein
MTYYNFYYWLKGLFELSDVTELSENQVKLIKSHLLLVKKKEPLHGFCLWLDGFLSGSVSKSLDKAQTQLVKTNLTSYFIELIDSNGLKSLSQLDDHRYCLNLDLIC